MEKFDLIPLLDYISPDDYEVWTNVGMALKHEGYSCYDWEYWSRNSSKYHPGECESKWNTFNENTDRIVTGATITLYAKQGGWTPDKQPRENKFLAWDDVIGTDKVKSIVDEGLVEKEPIPLPPKDWKPAEQLLQYLDALFQPDEIVGYVAESIQKDGTDKFVPKNSGSYKRTAGDIMKMLRSSSDITDAIGTYDRRGGVWIRINPLDGQGVLNANVADFRHALVESDDISLEKQYSILKQMQLPIAALVHSGGKSLHAIVKVNALDKDDYNKKVQFLYQVCEKSGLKVDVKNKNPSRLSRMPGIERAGKKQYLIATNIGCESWDKWVEHVALIDNELPDPENLSDLFDKPPVMAGEVIEGILRQGHKMLIAGASKAGKSFLLMELCVALNSGGKWLKWKCAQGKVLYINLEIDKNSCRDRFIKIMDAMHVSGGLPNVDLENLRGMAAPMDKLVDKLIFMAKDAHYDVIIIDPIYKVITGDENSASDMAHFTNQFDKLAENLGCSVIYCHHHSKGTQADKRVADRASGSGVFARDADALLDMIELEVPLEVKNQIFNDKVCNRICELFSQTQGNQWCNGVPEHELHSYSMLERRAVSWEERSKIAQLKEEVQKNVDAMTAWRIEGTLREFPKFAPLNFWFDYPIHYLDKDGLLNNAQPVGATNPYVKGGEATRQASEQKRLNDDLRLKQCYEKLASEHEEVTFPMLMDAFNDSRDADGEKTLTRQAIQKKVDKCRYLEKVGRTDEKNKSLPALIRLKPEEINEDFPEGFFDT